ncbi:hypothetical protein A7A08_02913 [Methyloligella halotolerans]|uniref:DUF3426 domain-containing protein n=2 Tax=Methyloligella halotolerans TaxID=1177755 RepID=A0A1E2RVI9_9HYPH|nr:hypothetical protein A7A08_02913 [Methyloligella halotolerans]
MQGGPGRPPAPPQGPRPQGPGPQGAPGQRPQGPGGYPPEGRPAQAAGPAGETRSAPPPPPPPGGPQADADFGHPETGADASFNDTEETYQEDADFGFDDQYGEEPPAPPKTTTPVVAEPRKEGGIAAKLGRTREGPGGQGALLLAGWSLLGLFVVGVLAIFLLMPASVMAALPGSAHLYQAMGIAPVEKAALGFENVTYKWTRYQGQRMLQVEGQIVNFTEADASVPNVLIALLDENGDKISEWMAPGSETNLGAEGRSEFATQIPSPPDTVRSFRVRFQQEG